MKRYDLNLLASLDALLTERSVSRAAERMGIGQPAMSAALSRLRALFDDPILVRSARGMEPTKRAGEVAESLRTVLRQLDQIVEPLPDFDPGASERTFRMSGGDYVGMTILPRLMARLTVSAPGISIRFRYLEKDAALAALDQDGLDLAFLVMDALPPRFDSAVLIDETFVGAARPGHPILDRKVDLRAFTRGDHLLITERGDARGCIDEALEREGLSRRIALTVPSVALVAEVLQATDFVASLPRRAAERLRQARLVELFDLPMAVPGWRMKAVWSRRNAMDPALLWLRDQITEVCLELEGRPDGPR